MMGFIVNFIEIKHSRNAKKPSVIVSEKGFSCKFGGGVSPVKLKGLCLHPFPHLQQPKNLFSFVGSKLLLGNFS